MKQYAWAWIIFGSMCFGACSSSTSGNGGNGGTHPGTTGAMGGANGTTSGVAQSSSSGAAQGSSSGALASSTPSDAATNGPQASLVVKDGLVTAGPWTGYGFTASDGPAYATITPVCANNTCTPAFTGSNFCMSGTVVGRTDYAGFAMLGWDVAQADGGIGAWTVTGTGITVTVSNPDNVPLRVQLQAPGGAHDGTKRWCAPLVSGTAIPWSSFTNQCWQTGTAAGNTLAVGQALENAAIIVYGAQTDRKFDNVCLVNITLN